MSQQYENLSNTESYFVVVLLVLYVLAILLGLLTWGEAPCVLDMDGACGFGEYFWRLLPFYGFTFALNFAIVLSAYYLNKLSKKSILIFRALTVPPLLLIFYYSYHFGEDLLKALTV